MVAESVPGLPHDSGQAEMMGPVIAIETLHKIYEESGISGKVQLCSDSAEAVKYSRNGRV